VFIGLAAERPLFLSLRVDARLPDRRADLVGLRFSSATPSSSSSSSCFSFSYLCSPCRCFTRLLVESTAASVRPGPPLKTAASPIVIWPGSDCDLTAGAGAGVLVTAEPGAAPLVLLGLFLPLPAARRARSRAANPPKDAGGRSSTCLALEERDDLSSSSYAPSGISSSPSPSMELCLERRT